ncbi:MAG: hypothetical protein JRF48_06965 [Deltaproteobacteria bacterium]|nr:hypothetical protein [Deltaproteobacteria bacterium]
MRDRIHRPFRELHFLGLEIRFVCLPARLVRLVFVLEPLVQSLGRPSDDRVASSQATDGQCRRERDASDWEHERPSGYGGELGFPNFRA